MTPAGARTVGTTTTPQGARACRPHRRQFVVGPEQSSPVTGWLHVRLEDLWLSHCPSLPVKLVADASGRPWALLGLAVESRADRPRPAEQIAAAPTSAVPLLYDGWAGRWALIGAGELHLDARGLLSCFWTLHGEEGSAWASSSPTLAVGFVSDAALREPRRWPLRYEDPVSWVVPPHSRYPGVSRLLPSQVLRLADGSARPRPLVAAFDPDRGYDETVSSLFAELTTALRRCVRSEPAWLGLTAGADSRLMLAAAYDSEVPVAAFTRRSARHTLADMRLPPLLAEAVGIEHRFTEGQRRPGMAALVAEHSGGHVGPGDAEPLVRGHRHGLDGFMLGGWGTSMGRDFRELPSSVGDPLPEEDTLRRLLHLSPRSPAVPALHDWLRWVSDSSTPRDRLELRDRFTIEQAQAGWYAAKEQLYDLDLVERIPLLNSHRAMGLLLSLPEEARVSRRWQHELIDRAAPELAAFAYNPPDRSFGLGSAAGRRVRHPVATAQRAGRRVRRRARSTIPTFV